MAEAALITGASSRLGLQYAKLFAADMKDLVLVARRLVARRKDRLEALADELSSSQGVKVHVIADDAAEVAREGYRAMLKGKPLAVHGLKNKVLTSSVRFSPRAIVRGIAASMNKPAGRQASVQLKT